MRKKLTTENVVLALASLALALGVTVARAATGLIDFSTNDAGMYGGPGYTIINGSTHPVAGLPGVTVTYNVIYPPFPIHVDGFMVGNDTLYAPSESDNSAVNGVGYLRLLNFTSTNAIGDLVFNQPVTIEKLNYSAYAQYSSNCATSVEFVGSLGGVKKWDSGVLYPTGGTPWVWNPMTAGAGILIDILEITGAPRVATLDQINLSDGVSPSPPKLVSQLSGTNFLLSWPLSAQNFNLQTTTNLADPNSWATLTNVPAIVNLQNTVTNPISGGMRFYRLKK